MEVVHTYPTSNFTEAARKTEKSIYKAELVDDVEQWKITEDVAKSTSKKRKRRDKSK